jgi:acyl-coenzyme A thioesterase PaaI-like protein
MRAHITVSNARHDIHVCVRGSLSDRTRVEYFRKADSTAVAKAWFGPRTEGPPGFVHGGCIAAVLDEAWGAAVWAESHESVSGKPTVKFLEMLALGSNVVIHVRLTRTTDRKVFAHCKMSNAALWSPKVLVRSSK